MNKCDYILFYYHVSTQYLLGNLKKKKNLDSFLPCHYSLEKKHTYAEHMCTNHKR